MFERVSRAHMSLIMDESVVLVGSMNGIFSTKKQGECVVVSESVDIKNSVQYINIDL